MVIHYSIERMIISLGGGEVSYSLYSASHSKTKCLFQFFRSRGHPPYLLATPLVMYKNCRVEQSEKWEGEEGKNWSGAILCTKYSSLYDLYPYELKWETGGWEVVHIMLVKAFTSQPFSRFDSNTQAVLSLWSQLLLSSWDCTIPSIELQFNYAFYFRLLTMRWESSKLNKQMNT